MRFLCVNCSYMYDESLGDVHEDIDPGTSIDAIDEDILCPGCEGSFDDFAPIEDEILYAENPNHHNHTEREHIPFILYQDHEKLEVSIGEEMHPISDDHRVTGIYLVDESGHIVEEIFIMPDEEPVAEFDISGLDEFELRASCSKHGLWSTGMLEAKE
ncbi:rubredoxin [Candidatus Gracilibacteria bacterium]|nr:rubredoxin [Candidatus Gracilibacteria bacterium]